MCELLERRLRFMTVRDSEQYTVPSLELLERNLEAAMYKVRCEKDRKIGGEISYLENIVRVQKTFLFRLLVLPSAPQFLLRDTDAASGGSNSSLVLFQIRGRQEERHGFCDKVGT
jgi:MADS-box transcription factor, plant